MLGVGSWDHLTTKGLIHELPDRVLVWNEAQKQEAVELHGVPAEQRGRHRRSGLRPLVRHAPVARSRRLLRPRRARSADRPILLYLCSSPFIAPYEVAFVRQWIGGDPASGDPRLRSAGVWCGRIPRMPTVGRRGTGCRVPRRGVLAEDRRQSDRRTTPEPTTSTRCITRKPWSA